MSQGGDIQNAKGPVLGAQKTWIPVLLHHCPLAHPSASLGLSFLICKISYIDVDVDISPLKDFGCTNF